MSTHLRTLAAAALAAAVLVLSACQPGDDEPTAPPASPTETATTAAPLSAPEVAQEAIRLWNADHEDEPDWRELMCPMFTNDALLLAPANDGQAIPMSRWCGQGSREPVSPPAWEVADQTPSIEEEKRQDSETWVRLMVGSRTNSQYVAALVQNDDGTWQVARWCPYDTSQAARDVTGGDDPFYCLAVTA